MRGFDVYTNGWMPLGCRQSNMRFKPARHLLHTRKNIDMFRAQLKRLGFAYDWDRELSKRTLNMFAGRNGSSSNSSSAV